MGLVTLMAWTVDPFGLARIFGDEPEAAVVRRRRIEGHPVTIDLDPAHRATASSAGRLDHQFWFSGRTAFSISSVTQSFRCSSTASAAISVRLASSRSWMS